MAIAFHCHKQYRLICIGKYIDNNNFDIAHVAKTISRFIFVEILR